MSKLKPHEKRSICSAEAPASMALTPPSPAPSPPPGETSRSKTHIFCFAPEDHKFIKIRWRPTAPSPAPSLVSDLPNAGTSARPQMGFSKDTTFPQSPDTPPPLHTPVASVVHRPREIDTIPMVPKIHLWPRKAWAQHGWSTHGPFPDWNAHAILSTFSGNDHSK